MFFYQQMESKLRALNSQETETKQENEKLQKVEWTALDFQKLFTASFIHSPLLIQTDKQTPLSKQ